MPNLYEGNCQYTPLTTATQTINPGPAVNAAGFRVPAPPSAYPSVFYGVNVLAPGGATVGVYDVIAPTGLGTNTATVTNTLAVGTLTGPGFVSPSSGIGYPAVRYQGALVVVSAIGAGNCLWD
jgi:hypothetical protein